MGSQNILIDFVCTGSIFGFSLESTYRRVSDILGESQDFVSRDPIFCAYGDLQLGFSKREFLWHIAIEPSSVLMDLPENVPGFSGRLQGYPSANELFDAAKIRGAKIIRCEPFVAGQIWFRIQPSGVLIHHDEEGAITDIHFSDKRIPNRDR